ncbi:transmembrane protein with metallophosphoesterase domain-like [Saccostrea echinata]|uniref:transmembrane protein with metallophosphoesterase domain-like n=1 Tax=Saccostrea echinata TaxID=191078 RepID=UPI002A832302|nr:transmembrane protein with metallophosphoesterase domain-like [Saccostrea echinata]
MESIRSKFSYILGGIFVVISIILAETWVLSLDFQTRGRILRAQFVFFMQIALLIADWMVWRSLATFFDASPSLRRSFMSKIWRTFLVLYSLLVHSSYLCNVLFVRTEPVVFSIVCYLCLAVQFQFVFLIILFKLLELSCKVLKGKAFHNKRIYFVAFILTFFLTGYGFTNSQKPPVIKNVRIPIRNLPQKLEGFTITLLSDIHLGVTVGKSKLDRIVSMVNGLNTDTVVIVGDLVDGPVEELRESSKSLTNIKSRYGIHYVTGNHEYYTMDANNWLAHLDSLGIKVLHNSNRQIPPGVDPKEQMCMAGTDDIEADRIMYDHHGFKLDKAVKGCNPGQPIILLAHQPKAAKMALQSDHHIDLVLSGHTHGGQFPPVVFGAYLFNPFYAGLYRYGDNSHVYVSMGTVYWGFPVRIMTTQEITFITLHAV